MKKILILLGLISGSAFAQKVPDYGFTKINITQADKTIRAELKPLTSDPETEVDRPYYWYSGNMIHITQGGFSGKLLNGEYTEYYLNRNLKEQGIFNQGLKDGTWKSWDENGTITQLYTWKKGIKSGKFSLFDNQGNLKQSGNYDNNLLNGQVKNYNGADKASVVNYNNGTVIMKKPSKFWKKLNVFKKNNKTIKDKTAGKKAIEAQPIKPKP